MVTEKKIKKAIKDLGEDDFLDLYYKGVQIGSIFSYDKHHSVEFEERNEGGETYVLMLTGIANIRVDEIVERSY